MSYDPKREIDQFIMPAVRSLQQDIRTVQEQMAEGSPWGMRMVADLSQQVIDLRDRLDRTLAQILNKDVVSSMIQEALQENKATGLTDKERRFRYLLGFASLLTTIVTIVTFTIALRGVQ